MRIQHNLDSMNVSRNLKVNQTGLNSSIEKLSSGYRINRAADDAAGLTISEKMRWQVKGLNKATDNAMDGINIIQIMDGALSEVTSILQRMREIAIQCYNDTNTTTDREAMNDEWLNLKDGIDEIWNSTIYNSQKLLLDDQTDVNNSKKLNLQIGSLSQQSITIELPSTTAGGSRQCINPIDNIYNFVPNSPYHHLEHTDDAINLTTKFRSQLGAVQNRLEKVVNNLMCTSENTSSAESRIRDTDMATEMVAYSKHNILAQTGQSMLAQANQKPQSILSILTV